MWMTNQTCQLSDFWRAHRLVEPFTAQVSSGLVSHSKDICWYVGVEASKLPKNMNPGLSQNKWTRRENVWTSETKTAKCLWTPYPHEVIYRDVRFSPTRTNLPSLSLRNKAPIVLYYIFLSADSLFFQELFSKSPPQLRHTLEDNSLRLKIAPCEVTHTLVNSQQGTQSLNWR